MLILGIDPGYGRLGYALLQKTGDKESLIDCGCVETLKTENHYERILKIAEEIEKKIKKNKPDILAIEKIYFTKNQKTAMDVAEIKGIIIFLAIKNGLEIKEYSPLEIKMAVCGYGKAEKNQVKKMVELLIGPGEREKIGKNQRDDVYDAIAVALTESCRSKYL